MKLFQKLEGCRRSASEKPDQPVLRALPPLRYEPIAATMSA